MPRLFVGIALPEGLTQTLSLMGGGVPGARWEQAEKLHVTLRFIGDVDGGTARAVVDALATVEHDPFSLTLAGVGHFPPRGKPRVLWVGVDDPGPVQELKRRVDGALADLDLEADTRKFSPHVTLARLKRSPPARVAEYIAHHSLFRGQPFEVQAFQLYSSVLSPSGSKYRVEAAFGLG